MSGIGSILGGLAASSTSPDSEYMSNDPKKIGAIIGALSGSLAAGNQAQTRFVNPPSTPATAQQNAALATPLVQGSSVPAWASNPPQQFNTPAAPDQSFDPAQKTAMLIAAKKAQQTGEVPTVAPQGVVSPSGHQTDAQAKAIQAVNEFLGNNHPGNEVDMHPHNESEDTRIHDAHDLRNAANLVESKAYENYGKELGAEPPESTPLKLNPVHAGLSLLLAGLMNGAGKGFSNEGGNFGNSFLQTLQDQNDSENEGNQQSYENKMAQQHALYTAALQHSGSMKDAAQSLQDEYFRDQANKIKQDQFAADSRSQAESDSLGRVSKSLDSFQKTVANKTATPQSIQAAYDALQGAVSNHQSAYPNYAGVGVTPEAVKSLKDQALAGQVATQSKQWSDRLNKERNASGFFDETRAGQLDKERNGIFSRLGIAADPNDDQATADYKEGLRNSIEVPTTEKGYKMQQGEERVHLIGARLDFLKGKEKDDFLIKNGNLAVAKGRLQNAIQRERDLTALGTDRNAIMAANAATRAAEANYDSTVDNMNKEINKLQSAIEKKNISLEGQKAKVIALASDPLSKIQAQGVLDSIKSQKQALEALRAQKIRTRNEAAQAANQKASGAPPVDAARQEGLKLSLQHPDKAAAIKARFKQTYGQDL